MSDAMRGVLTTSLSWVLAFLFLCVAIYDVKRSSPAQFFPWLKIKAEMLNDVRTYNCDNCTMWMSCFFVFIIVGFVGIFNSRVQAALYLLCLFPGGLFLCRRYKRILRSSLKEEIKKNTEEPRS